MSEHEVDRFGDPRPSAAACIDFNGEWWEPYYSHRNDIGICPMDGEAWPCRAERTTDHPPAPTEGQAS